jgi:hypothetical protein
VGLDLGSSANDDRSLNLNEGTNKHTFAELALIEVTGHDNTNAVAADDATEGAVYQLRLGHLSRQHCFITVTAWLS